MRNTENHTVFVDLTSQIGKQETRFNSFAEAFRAFHNRSMALCDEGVTLQMLETALWIQHQRGHEPIFLYDLINIGHDTGLLTKDGTLAE